MTSQTCYSVSKTTKENKITVPKFLNFSEICYVIIDGAKHNILLIKTDLS